MRHPRIVALVVTVFVAISSHATADPRHGFVIPADCDNGKIYDLVVFSDAIWSPGLVADGTSVFVPVAISSTGVFYPAGGGDPEVWFQDDFSKTRPRAHRSLLSCTFTATETLEDGTIFINGHVDAFLAPPR